MPRGYRSVILAAVGWLILCGQAPKERTESKGENGTQTAKQGARAAPPPVQSVEQVKASEYERPCDQQRDNRNSDLCAQWKAADAARDAADWARWQFYLAIAGTLGLLVSIYYTRRAVLAAVSSNENAQEALAHAKQMAEVEMRPYLHIDEIAFRKADAFLDRGHIIVRIKNFGSTPAIRFRVEAGADIRNLAKAKPGNSLFIQQRWYRTVDEIPPNHSATITIPNPPRGASLSGHLTYLCAVQFRYADKFGSEYMRWETWRSEGLVLGEGEFRFYCHNQGV